MALIAKARGLSLAAVLCSAGVPAFAGWQKLMDCVSDIHIVSVGTLTLGHGKTFSLSPTQAVVGCIMLEDGSMIDKVVFECPAEDNESMMISWQKTQVIGRCNLKPKTDPKSTPETPQSSEGGKG